MHLVNKCEYTVTANVWAMSDCAVNGGALTSVTGIVIPPLSDLTLAPLFPAATNPNSHWHVASASTVIATVPHSLNIQRNPQICIPSTAWPNFFSGALLASWQVYWFQGLLQNAIIFTC